MATANFGVAPVELEEAAAVAAVAAAAEAAAAVNTGWGKEADESYILAHAYWTKLMALKAAWVVANTLPTVAEKAAALKKLPILVDYVPRGGSRKKRQSKKRKNNKNHSNNNQ